MFVDLPQVGAKFKKGDAAAVVESVKAASDVFAPASGEVVAVNDKLAATPSLVNEDAQGQGWLFKLKLSAPSELDGLMDADGLRRISEDDRLMRYLPLDADDRRLMLQRIGVGRHRRLCSPTSPRAGGFGDLLPMPRRA